MKTDQDLIFEAYATTLNENDESRAKNIQRGQEAISAAQEEYYKQFGAEAFEDHYGFPYPHAEDNEGSVSKYYKQAYDYAIKNPDVSSFQVNPYEEFSDEYLEFEDGFEDGLAQSGDGWSEEDENYTSEGAVNLLEQLKEEVPEIEDKINQILEKVFDAVDILKQESYADDPQLQKAYDSLIEGDF